jgi:hypothetical protein
MTAQKRIWIDDERPIGGTAKILWDPPGHTDPYTTEWVPGNLMDDAAKALEYATSALEMALSTHDTPMSPDQTLRLMGALRQTRATLAKIKTGGA